MTYLWKHMQSVVLVAMMRVAISMQRERLEQLADRLAKVMP
jgi:hypothetical protein